MMSTAMVDVDIYVGMNPKQIIKRDGKLAYRDENSHTTKDIKAPAAFDNPEDAFAWVKGNPDDYANPRDKSDTLNVFHIRGSFPEGSVFKMQDYTSEYSRQSFRFSNFIAALNAARGRGEWGYGYGAISIMNPQLVFDTTESMLEHEQDTYEKDIPIYQFARLNSKYFTIIENMNEKNKAAADPDYALYVALRQRFEAKK